MKTFQILALGLATMPAAAMAGGMAQPVTEPVIEAPMPVTIAAPNGDWNGAYVGAALGFGNFTAGGGANNGNEGVAGVNFGYRKDLGKMVLGGELSYSKNDIGVNSASNQINNTTALKLMLGADMGRTLVYVSGGVAQANATLSGVSATDNGYFGGLGVDYQLNDKWTVGGEVLSGAYNNFNNSGVNLKDTTLQFKVGMRF